MSVRWSQILLVIVAALSIDTGKKSPVDYLNPVFKVFFFVFFF